MSNVKDSSVRVVVRLRGGITKTQEVNKTDKSAQTVCVNPQKPIVFVPSEENKNGELNSNSSKCLFKEIFVDRSSTTATSDSQQKQQKQDDKDLFTFDTVFGPETTQETIYENVGEPALKSALEGFNACIFCYGQSSSGKSHTLFGKPEQIECLSAINENSGVIPRTIIQLFDKLQSLPESEITFGVELSVFELYNENLYDLLICPLVESNSNNNNDPSYYCDTSSSSSLPCSSPATLRIREDRGSGGPGIFIEGMTKRQITSASQALRCIVDASQKKHVAETGMNRTSSRSHTIVQLFITQINHVNGGTKLSSQFFLVDLAGSERISRTGAVGGLLKEAQSINLSLTLLGNVINKLTDGKSTHIPYRDSKLTRLLEDALGGNSTTTLICTTSVLAIDMNETLSTLNFATRAKAVKNAPRANLELSGDALKDAYARSQSEIAALKRKIKLLEAEVQILSLSHVSKNKNNNNTNNNNNNNNNNSKSSTAFSPVTPKTPSSNAVVGIQALRRNSSKGSFSNATPTTFTGNTRNKEQQQQLQLQSPDQVSSFFENIVLEDLQGTIASLITDLNTEKEERQYLTNERDDAIKRVEFHVIQEKMLSKKVEDLETKLLETTKRLLLSENALEEKRNEQRTDPNYERELLQKRLSEGLRALRQPQSNSNDTPNNIVSNNSLAALAEREKFESEISELRQKVANLTQKLNSNSRSEEESEKIFTRRAENLEIQHKAELEEVQKEYQRASEMTEQELIRLQGKLDVRVAEITKLKQELEESENSKEGLRNQVRQAHASIQSVLSDEHQNAAVLLLENKNNGERIRQLVSKNEAQEKTIRELTRDIDSLMRDIEGAPIAADIKAKLLVRESLQQQRSVFKKKLLECFSYE